MNTKVCAVQSKSRPEVTTVAPATLPVTPAMHLAGKSSFVLNKNRARDATRYARDAESDCEVLGSYDRYARDA